MNAVEVLAGDNPAIIGQPRDASRADLLRSPFRLILTSLGRLARPDALGN